MEGSRIIRNFESIVLFQPSLPKRVLLFDAVLREVFLNNSTKHELTVAFDSLRTCRRAVSLIQNVSSSNKVDSVCLYCNHRISSYKYTVSHYHGSIYEHTFTEPSNPVSNSMFMFEVDKTFCIEQGSPVSGHKGDNFLSWEYYRHLFNSSNVPTLD